MKLKIEIVNEYTYIWVFTSQQNWNGQRQQQHWHNKHQRPYLLYIYERKCDGLPLVAAMELFDKMILPVLFYGAEIWGSKEWPVIEKVHMKFLERLLRVSQSTPNAAVYGETGRMPLADHYKKDVLNIGRNWKQWMTTDIRSNAIFN